MKTQIPERLSALREAMKQQHISAYIIPTTDPHMSEGSVLEVSGMDFRFYRIGRNRSCNIGKGRLVDRLTVFLASRNAIGR